jgi:hypothetical protein
MMFRLQQNLFFLSFGVAAAGIAQKKGRADSARPCVIVTFSILSALL